jgi:hypothetical protein
MHLSLSRFKPAIGLNDQSLDELFALEFMFRMIYLAIQNRKSKKKTCVSNDSYERRSIFVEVMARVQNLLSDERKKLGLKGPKMDTSIYTRHNEATHHAIVEACGPPNILGAPIEAERPENSPNGVKNGPSLVVAAITNERQI